MSIIEKDEQYLLGVYKKFPITFVKGEGAHLWDDKGNEFLDFYAGHAVCSMGQRHKAVTDAVKSAAEEMTFYSNVFYMQPQVELAQKIAQTLLPETYKVYFANSGSEANETATKIARKYTGKKKIISFENAFHGRAISNISITGISGYHKFEPNLDEYTLFAKLGDMGSVKDVYDDEVAAVICEPIQSVGGMNMAELTFYKELSEFCKEQGILLIFDEVQTGCGRSGEVWFADVCGVYPDIITTAKGIAAGLPLSAVIVHEEVADKVEVGDHATTFGGGNIPCSAGLAVFETLTSYKFLDEVKRKSKKIIEGLNEIEGVVDVLGMGFLLGIKFDEDVSWLVKECLKEGLIIGSCSNKNVIRLTPPLIITDDDIDKFFMIFKKVLANKKSDD